MSSYKDSIVDVCRYLVSQKLTCWTSGNASTVNEKTKLLYIKPSGVKPMELRPEHVSEVDTRDGRLLSGLKPSVDLNSHLELYRNYNIGAIIHTHSTYATAFAACGRDIPCALIPMAYEFIGPVRCTEYAEIGGYGIFQAVSKVFAKYNCQKAVLLKQHGVLTFGKNLDEALKTAVTLEDCAKTLIMASKIGLTSELTAHQIQSNWHIYTQSYGQ